LTRDMHIRLERIYNCANYCIGHLYADKEFVCDTIEDTDRGLDESWSLEQIKKVKVQNKTAIPTGTYRVTINVVSPKFSKKDYYKKHDGGRLPRLLSVKGFEGILIHRGVNEKSSAGCLIVGYNKIKGAVVDSQRAYEKLYSIMKLNNGNITITITRKYNVFLK